MLCAILSNDGICPFPLGYPLHQEAGVESKVCIQPLHQSSLHFVYLLAYGFTLIHAGEYQRRSVC